MNPKIKALGEQYEKKNTRLDELIAKGVDISVEEATEMTTVNGELDELLKQINAEKALEDIRGKSVQRGTLLNTPMSEGGVAVVQLHGGKTEQQATQKKMMLPASAKRSRVTAFKADSQFSAHEKAYRFGKWFLATVCKHAASQEFCKEHGLPMVFHQGEKTGQIETVNSLGGWLVPDEFENDMIDLREAYGIFRNLAKRTTMRSDTKSVPRRTSGLTAYFVGEGGAGTESTKGWDRVALTARKIMVLARYSSELDEDSLIDMANDLAEEIAYAFAQKEDDCGFNGDGTSAYGTIIGVRPRLRAVDATIANIKGLKVATGNTWSEITLADFNGAKALLPQYARKSRRNNVKWHAHSAFYYGVMEKLMLASGGVTAREVADGREELIFMGHPVEISQVLPSVEANSSICCLFGDLMLAATFGDRRQTTLALSEHAAFETDELLLRGTERFDINVHDVGDTAAAGPIVGLITAAA